MPQAEERHSNPVPARTNTLNDALITPITHSSRTNSWEKKHAIAYNVETQRLTKEDRKNVEKDYTSVPIRKHGLRLNDRVEISVPVGSDPSNVQTRKVVANVKMDSLGFRVKIQRVCGNITEIFVKGTPRTLGSWDAAQDARYCDSEQLSKSQVLVM